MKAVKLTISGKVQGVGYRRWFAQYAVALGLKGYVMNLDSGAVEALLLGHDEFLDLKDVSTVYRRACQAHTQLRGWHGVGGVLCYRR